MTEEKSHGISIKWKLFFYLALFTAFVLLVVWVFQVLLLDMFYERTKFTELHDAAAELAELVDDEELLKAKAEEVLSESIIYSKIFQVDSEGNAILLASQEGAGNYYIKYYDKFNMDEILQAEYNDRINELFSAAVNSGGIYYMRRTVDKVENVNNQPGHNNTHIVPAENNNYTADDIERKEIVYVQLVSSNESIYVIILNMIYSPLDSTVNTLDMQFFWIAVILLGGALFLTGIMSYRISTPIVRMNESAKRLAKGKYDADFSGDGYRETHELAATLNYASEELSKADNLQKDLIANISHDLRTPLTMITGYSEVMRDIPGENTPENVQVIIDESTRLSELVNDLLDLSKIQAGTVRFEKSAFNLTETVRSTMQRYSKLASHDGFRIEFFADSEVSVNADRTRMLQVIYNLINNALNYSGNDKLVTVKQTIIGNKVRISVSDNGEGIAPEDIPLIWDRYYKVDRVHKRAVVGTGLGLSIVKGILESHDALYGVESQLGQGSTFWFELSINNDYLLPPDINE